MAVFDVFGDPVDALVEFAHAFFDFGDRNEPGRYCFVDQRVSAAPAVWVGVHVGRFFDEAAHGAEVPDDGGVGVEDVDAGDVGEGAVSKHGEEAGGVVDAEDDGDACFGAGPVVFFTVGGGLVHDAGTVGGGDVVFDEDLPGVFGAPRFGVGVVVPQGGVPQAAQVGAGVAAGDGGFCGFGVFEAEVFGVGGELFLG